MHPILYLHYRSHAAFDRACTAFMRRIESNNDRLFQRFNRGV